MFAAGAGCGGLQSYVENRITMYHTEAEICYTFAGLTDKGNMMNRHILASMFAHDLKASGRDQINLLHRDGTQRKILFI